MRPTEKYRALLDRQRQTFLDSFEKLFLSIQVILDNVDQVMDEHKKQKQQSEEPVQVRKRIKNETR